jgi:basic membrane protein A
MTLGDGETVAGPRASLSRRRLLGLAGGGAMVALLAACGGGAAPTATPAPPKAVEPTKPAAPAPTTAPAAAPTVAPTAAPAAAATKPAEPTKPAAAPTVAPTTAPAVATKPATAFRVGLVTDVGKVDDKSFNQSAWEGVQQAQKELGAEIKFIETTDPKDYAKNIAQFGDANYNAIVTVGFALGEETVKAAKKYQNIKFIGVDQFQTEVSPNLAGLIFDEDKAGYLVGALAALMSKSGTIGGVLGTDAVPPVWRFGEGFKVGAMAVRPDIKVNLVYHNDVGFDKTFTDPEWGKTTALSMIAKGADVIFGAGGKTGNGALLGCAEKNVMAIGVDTDQYFTVPEAQKVLLSSGMKLIVPGTFNLLKTVKDGSFKGGNITGEVGLAPFHEFESKVPAEVKTKLADIDKGLKNGTIKTNVPPAKPA